MNFCLSSQNRLRARMHQAARTTSHERWATNHEGPASTDERSGLTPPGGGAEKWELQYQHELSTPAESAALGAAFDRVFQSPLRETGNWTLAPRTGRCRETGGPSLGSRQWTGD
jgi:hypothetical protein